MDRIWTCFLLNREIFANFVKKNETGNGGGQHDHPSFRRLLEPRNISYLSLSVMGVRSSFAVHVACPLCNLSILFSPYTWAKSRWLYVSLFAAHYPTSGQGTFCFESGPGKATMATQLNSTWTTGAFSVCVPINSVVDIWVLWATRKLSPDPFGEKVKPSFNACSCLAQRWHLPAKVWIGQIQGRFRSPPFPSIEGSKPPFPSATSGNINNINHWNRIG